MIPTMTRSRSISSAADKDSHALSRPHWKLYLLACTKVSDKYLKFQKFWVHCSVLAALPPGTWCDMCSLKCEIHVHEVHDYANRSKGEQTDCADIHKYIYI